MSMSNCSYLDSTIIHGIRPRTLIQAQHGYTPNTHAHVTHRSILKNIHPPRYTHIHTDTQVRPYTHQDVRVDWELNVNSYRRSEYIDNYIKSEWEDLFTKALAWISSLTLATVNKYHSWLDEEIFVKFSPNYWFILSFFFFRNPQLLAAVFFF